MKTITGLDTPRYPSELRYEPRNVGGFRPVVEPHLGFHFGVVEHVISEQSRHPGSTYSLIADWHATTSWSGRGNMQQATLATVAALLALGVNPYKTVLFAQSHVTGLGEMAWLLSCMTPESLLLHNPASRNTPVSKHSIGAVLYPVLMAADVLSLRGTKIAVMRDQVINCQKVRQIARIANRLFDAPVFPVPAVVVRGESIRGTDGARMDFDRKNHIPVFTGLRELKERVQQIQTDSRGTREPKDPDACAVFQLYSIAAPPARVAEMRSRYLAGAIGYEDAKRELVIAIVERFAAPRQQYEEWMKRPDDLRDVLRKGAQVASAEVSVTLAQVREKLGLAL